MHEPRAARPLSFAALLVGLAAFAAPPSSPAAPETALGPRTADPPSGGEFPDGWYYSDHRTGARYAGPLSLEGKPPPPLKIRDWIGRVPDLEHLRGKVVVVDFWATWCGPCMRSIPENVRMVETYKDRHLLVIGIHDAHRGTAMMRRVVESRHINYPVGIDDGGASVRAWKLSFWPTYAVIDHRGIVRAAGLYPHRVEAVVRKLLDERDHEVSVKRGAGTSDP